MDINKLPYIPLHFFYYQFTTGSKRLFLFVFGLIILLSACCLFAYHAPFHWSLQINEIPEVVQENVKVAEIQGGYNSFPLEGSLFKSWVNFSASPLRSSPFPVILFWIIQIIAWSLVLAAATFIRSRWHFLFYFLFGAFLHSSDVVSILFQSSNIYIEFGILMAFLGLAYLFQMYTLKWPVVYRFLVFLAMLTLVFGLAWQRSSWIEMHRLSASIYPFLTIVSLVFLIFIAKEPTNLVIFATTNHRNPARRRPLPQIAIALGILLLWELLLALVYTNVIEIKTMGFRPMHLLIISAIFTIFTSQNRFHAYRNALTTVNVYTIMIGAWVLISLSFWLLMMASGDVFFTDIIEELGIIFAFSIGVGQTLFLFMEFSDLLKNKVNLYYWMGQAGLKLTMVWLIGAIGFVVLEGRAGWRMNTMLEHSYYTNWGDSYFMKEKWDDASYYYRAAIDGTIYQLGQYPVKFGGARFSPKPNYNLAAIYVNNNKVKEAVSCYQLASYYYYFPYAILNAGNLFNLVKQPNNAKKLWNIDKVKGGNPLIANNLAFVYYAQNKADSAITALKFALKKDPKMSVAYSNMAEIYWKNKKADEGKKFSAAALDFSKPNKAAIANAIYHAIVDTLQAKIPDIDVKNEQDINILTNYAVYLMRNNRNKEAVEVWESTLKLYGEDTPIDAELLTAFSMFREDSVAKATSKVDFIGKQVLEQSGKAYYTLGVAYYERGLPEMAKHYFREMTVNGDTSGFYFQALVDAQMGRADSAFMKLSALRGYNKNGFAEKIAKELAILYLSRGLDQSAVTEYQGSFTKNEDMRRGIYADSAGNFAFALNGFRTVIDKDSSDAAPYTEMLKIYRKYGNKDGISNAEYALKRFPKDPKLQIEAAKLYLSLNDVQKANPLIDQLKQLKDSTFKYDIRLLESDVFSLKQQSAQASPILQQLIKKDPMRPEAYIRLCDIYWKTGKSEEGYKTIYDALKYNTENADIWLYYTRFIKLYSNDEAEIKYGANRAIDLSSDPKIKTAIFDEFKGILAPEGMGRSDVPVDSL